MVIRFKNCGNLSTETTIELVDTSAGFDLLLLAGVERMAFRANVEFKNVAFLSRAGYESCSASAHGGDFLLIGMYIFFNCTISCIFLA